MNLKEHHKYQSAVSILDYERFYNAIFPFQQYILMSRKTKNEFIHSKMEISKKIKVESSNFTS